MHVHQYNFTFEVYASASELPPADAELVQEARAATAHAYAPYSQFHVGAAARLTNGQKIQGTNQENASFPAGICAERVLLSAAASLYPGTGIETLAISYHNLNGTSNRPISPCGICRQSLLETEERWKQPIRIILTGLDGEVYVIPRASLLLPLSFGAGELVG
jgi:cytidine deaminase